MKSLQGFDDSGLKRVQFFFNDQSNPDGVDIVVVVAEAVSESSDVRPRRLRTKLLGLLAQFCGQLHSG